MPDLIKTKIFDKTIPGDNHKLTPGKKNLYNEAYGYLQSKKSIQSKTEINNKLKSQEVPDKKPTDLLQPKTKMADKLNSNVHVCDIQDFAKQFSGEKIAKLFCCDKPMLNNLKPSLEAAHEREIKNNHQMTPLLKIEQISFFPHRYEEDKYIDYKTAFVAYKIAGLDKYPGVTENLIPAILYNEQRGYKSPDAFQDLEVQLFGTVTFPFNEKSSIGSAQMQIRNIKHLIDAKDELDNPKYPYLQHMRDNSLKLAENPQNAALLTAAYLADKAKDLQSHGLPVNNRTLAYMWNYDVNLDKLKGSYYSVFSSHPQKANDVRQKYPNNENILQASGTVHDIMSQFEHVKNIKH